jgi:RNA polymerase sigma-70 factor (ECF subfamily)
VRQRLERIYRDHRQGLFTLALSITRRPEAAEDAVHDAFVRLWNSPVAPQGDPVAYVFACVRNAALDWRRRRPEPVELRASIFEDRGADPSVATADQEEAARLRGAVEGLPDDQREAVVLRLYAGLTFQKIADVLGQPLPTVASRYRRALERIKQQWGGVE